MKIAHVIVLAGLVSFAAPFALAQSTDEIRTQLLRPNGWAFDWSLSSTHKFDSNQTGQSGHGEILFQARGDAIVATIRSLPSSSSCERDVTISAGTVMFNGCIEPAIKLHFDSADHDFPFKGAGGLNDWRLKPK